MNVNGSVEWTPAVKWKVETRADKLNPGMQYPEWPGTISWLLKSGGHIDESGVFADVSISSLQGVLRDLPIAGSGDVTIAPENIRIDKLRLLSGDAKLTAQGLLGDASDLKWDIHITDFSDLLPESSGQLSASGAVLGKMTAPKITANLSGTSIVIPQAEIEDILPGSGSTADKPTTTKRTVSTSAIVNHAETIILGGLMKKTEGKGASGLPIFSEIPILGRLFKTEGKSHSKINVVIYLTPYIIKSSSDFKNLRKNLAELHDVQDQYNRIMKNKLNDMLDKRREKRGHVTFNTDSRTFYPVDDDKKNSSVLKKK